MTNPKLVEIVAREMHDHDHSFIHPRQIWDRAHEGVRQPYLRLATAALAAINASGTHWVAPFEATEQMRRASTMLAPTWDDDVSRAKWDAMRTAYLAEPKA